MRINHNIAALNTQNKMAINNNGASKAMEKLSSGLRVNRAADDAAGLSISEKMRGQIRGLNQAQRNAQDGISLIQTAEGALNEVSDMLVRVKELAVQKGTGTYNAADIANIDLEMVALGAEITHIGAATKFNQTAVITGSAAVDIVVSDSDLDKITIAAVAIPLAIAVNAATTTALADAAIDQVNLQRATLGSSQNRLEHVVNNLGTTAENLQAAESRVRDTDMAKEMSEFTKQNILLQASQAMLAQANQQPQGVLQLLR